MFCRRIIRTVILPVGKQETRTFFGFSITIVFTRLSPDFSKISLNETLASNQTKKQKKQKQKKNQHKDIKLCQGTIFRYYYTNLILRPIL